MQLNKYDFEEPEEEPIEKWDEVSCKRCGRIISMLDARLIKFRDGYEYFVCTDECK